MAGPADVEAAVEYEMHMLQDGAWQPAIEAAAPDSLLKAAERVLALRGVDGVRVVRASRFGEYDHVERVILVKWVSPGVTDPDGIGTPVLGARTVCLQTADFYREAPWMIIFPGLAISLAVFAFNLFGNSLRDWLDPKLKL